MDMWYQNIESLLKNHKYQIYEVSQYQYDEF
jgi:hypothetical protein